MIKVGGGIDLPFFPHFYMSAVQMAKLTVQITFISHGENQVF